MTQKKRRTITAVALTLAAAIGLALPVVLLAPGCSLVGPTPTLEDVDAGRLEVKDPTTGADRPATIDDLIAELTDRLTKVDAALVKLERAATAAEAVTDKVGDAVPGPVGDAADLVGWGVGFVGVAATAALARQKAKIQEELARALARKTEVEAQVAARAAVLTGVGS